MIGQVVHGAGGKLIYDPVVKFGEVRRSWSTVLMGQVQGRMGLKWWSVLPLNVNGRL